MTFDFVVQRGRILDGCGNPWFWGDLGIEAGRVGAIAPAGTLRGRREVDAAGRFVAPGFIDVHTHSDLSVLVNRTADNAVRQGVTTHIVGNCGMSPAPIHEARLGEIRHCWGDVAQRAEVTWSWRSFAEYLRALAEGGLGLNIGALVGHGALRLSAMGYEERAPSSSEMALMQQFLAEGMEAGAFGLSTGLVYPPGCFADTEEIIALARVAAQYHGLYASHVRGERETILEAVGEAIRIGREAGLAVQISHNAPKFGAPCDATANLALVEEARAGGQDVTVDNDVHTDLGVRLPWALPQHLQDRSVEQIRTLLQDPDARRRIRQEIIEDRRPGFGPAGLLRHERFERIAVLYADHTPAAAGKTIAALGEERGQDPFDVFFDLIVANGEAVEAAFDYIDPKNIRLLLQHPAVMICSDGQVAVHDAETGGRMPYGPCDYGEFPGVLERYVREEPVLTLQEAVRKMTSFPAQRFGLWDRGTLRPGAWADVVVFDLDRVHDRATCVYPYEFPLENFPHRFPEGIDYVWVNGGLVVDAGEPTGHLPGQVLKKRA